MEKRRGLNSLNLKTKTKTKPKKPLVYEDSYGSVEFYLKTRQKNRHLLILLPEDCFGQLFLEDLGQEAYI